ncbi:MAG: twitching motility protein PilT [Lachnospiraceae bacterium]|nr:twitching motility protein PilT [Lachnospiraceae bacterium]
MIQLILGEKGKGKTKVLLDKANEAAKGAKGSLVFVDKDSSHILELKNSIRLVDVSKYALSSSDEFYGFTAGIISADHDLEQLFIDALLLTAYIKDDDYIDLLRKIDRLSETYGITVTISMSVTKDQLPGDMADKVIVAL